MSSENISKNYTTSVAANSNSSSTYVPATDEHILVTDVKSFCDFTGYTKCEIIWDDGGAQAKTVFLSYGTESQILKEEFIGNNSRAIKIKLTNDFNEAIQMGCAWEGRKFTIEEYAPPPEPPEQDYTPIVFPEF